MGRKIRHYLMIKTHNITGLKYLCKKTTHNILSCFDYKGSGVYWKKHLKVHGVDISTEIIEQCDTNQELKECGIFWSKKLDVVKSNDFANLVEESGDGGPTMTGRKITQYQKYKQSKALVEFYKNASDEYKQYRRNINSTSHEIYRYYTPAGIFTNAYTAAKSNNCTNVTILNRCKVDVDKIITSKKYWRFGWKGKTWRELGWYYERLNQ